MLSWSIAWSVQGYIHTWVLTHLLYLLVLYQGHRDFHPVLTVGMVFWITHSSFLNHWDTSTHDPWPSPTAGTLHNLLCLSSLSLYFSFPPKLSKCTSSITFDSPPKHLCHCKMFFHCVIPQAASLLSPKGDQESCSCWPIMMGANLITQISYNSLETLSGLQFCLLRPNTENLFPSVLDTEWVLWCISTNIISFKKGMFLSLILPTFKWCFLLCGSKMRLGDMPLHIKDIN